MINKQFSSVQDGIYALEKAHLYALHPVSQRCLWNGSSVSLTDDGPLSTFWGRLSSTSFYSSLLQITDNVMSLALCLQVVSQAPRNNCNILTLCGHLDGRVGHGLTGIALPDCVDSRDAETVVAWRPEVGHDVWSGGGRDFIWVHLPSHPIIVSIWKKKIVSIISCKLCM